MAQARKNAPKTTQARKKTPAKSPAAATPRKKTVPKAPATGNRGTVSKPTSTSRNTSAAHRSNTRKSGTAATQRSTAQKGKTQHSVASRRPAAKGKQHLTAEELAIKEKYELKERKRLAKEERRREKEKRKEKRHREKELARIEKRREKERALAERRRERAVRPRKSVWEHIGNGLTVATTVLGAFNTANNYINGVNSLTQGSTLDKLQTAQGLLSGQPRRSNGGYAEADERYDDYDNYSNGRSQAGTKLKSKYQKKYTYYAKNVEKIRNEYMKLSVEAKRKAWHGCATDIKINQRAMEKIRNECYEATGLWLSIGYRWQTYKLPRKK